MMMFGDCCSCLVLLFMFGDFVCLCSFKLVFLNFGDVRASVCVCVFTFVHDAYVGEKTWGFVGDVG